MTKVKVQVATLDDTGNVPLDQLGNAASGVGMQSWLPATFYTEGAQAAHNGQLYSRISSGTSASTWSADSSNWTPLGAGISVLDGGTVS